MAKLPGVYSQEYEHRRYLVDHQAMVRGKDVVVDERAASPLPPPYRIVPGTTIVRVRGGDRYVEATNPLGDRNQPASVSALQPADAAWANTQVTVTHAPGLGFLVPLGAQVVDNATAVAALNQDAAFATRYLADEDPAGRVRIRTRDAGATAYLHVKSSLQAAFGADGASGSGADADYRVTDALAELVELHSGRRIPASVATLFAGHFVEPALLHLTPEARVVLSRRGSIFRSF
jgi:hypothetical protein